MREEVPVEVWLGGAESHPVISAVGPPGTRAEIDPEGDFLDVDREEIVWIR